VSARDPSLPQPIDDDDEERTVTGDVPPPAPAGSFLSPSTPTAFTPHGAAPPAHGPPPVPSRPPDSPRETPSHSGPPGPRGGSSGPQAVHRPQAPPHPPSSMMQGAPPASQRHPQSQGSHSHHASSQQHPPSQQHPSSQGAQPLGLASDGAPAPPPPQKPQRPDVSFAGSTGGGTSMMAMPQQAPLAVRPDQAPRELQSSPFHTVRSRAYAFVLDPRGNPVELGSGRFAKAYLGEERWLESKTDFRRPIVIKILQKGVSEEDHMRFQMEKELLERVQGHPNIIELFASGEGEEPTFLPPSIRDKVEPEFMILERLDMSLEERLKGSRDKGSKEDLLAYGFRERLFRVLDYTIPIASAVEYAHLVRNICHRDIKPANVLVGLADTNLRGSTLQVRLADFNVAKLSDNEVSYGMTQMKTAVPGTLFFQSPEQETNIIELLVNVQQGSPEVEFFEDFYIQIAKNDNFGIFNRDQNYSVLYADRTRKRLVLSRPYRESSESNVRARVQKSVGRPADIYSLGATFYYLISGAYANPKTLYDAFHKFIEYERADENNTIESYLRHEYSVINSLRAPKTQDGSPEVAPADRFFSYKHYLDGNGELIDPNVMLVIARCMIRNKPDSYCQAHDLETRGISELVTDLINLYSLYGFTPGTRPTHLVHRTSTAKRAPFGGRLKRLWVRIASLFRRKK
jgi:serine/threonine protein kinase